VEFTPFGGVMLFDWEKMSRWSMLQKLWGQTECARVCHHMYPVFRFVVFF
jgi:hypothetical protein